jgi:hypothetical protein
MIRYIKELRDAWERRRDKILYRQWMEHYDLPPREISADVPKARKGPLYQQWVEEGNLKPEDIPQEPSVSFAPQENIADPVQVKRLIGYMIIEGIAIVVLLIALTVTLTLLIVK